MTTHCNKTEAPGKVQETRGPHMYELIQRASPSIGLDLDSTGHIIFRKDISTKLSQWNAIHVPFKY